MSLRLNCRHFNGYRPCAIAQNQCAQCLSYEEINTSILLIHLGAIGAVLRSTSLLNSIKKKYPKSMITWVTEAPSDRLLANHPLIDQVLRAESDQLLFLKARHFDVAFVIDKSAKAVGISAQLSCSEKFGFSIDPKTGAIRPANPEAEELWSLGIDNQKKFFVNNKSEVQLVAEALRLTEAATYLPQNFLYNLPLTTDETAQRDVLKKNWRRSAGQPIVGINTGCSEVIPYKKLTIDYQRRLIQFLIFKGFKNIVLLGGPEDSSRNEHIARDLPVFQSETTKGLRSGLVSVAACDILITGDSLGMHMAISQNKFVIAWFGPTCEQEIELFDNGVKIKTRSPCAPCWKRTCDKAVMCYDQVDLLSIMSALEVGTTKWQSLNLKEIPRVQEL